MLSQRCAACLKSQWQLGLTGYKGYQYMYCNQTISIAWLNQIQHEVITTQGVSLGDQIMYSDKLPFPVPSFWRTQWPSPQPRDVALRGPACQEQAPKMELDLRSLHVLLWMSSENILSSLTCFLVIVSTSLWILWAAVLIQNRITQQTFFFRCADPCAKTSPCSHRWLSDPCAHTHRYATA